MKKTWMIAVLVVAGIAYGVAGQDDDKDVKEPKELVTARTTYQTQIKVATDPIKAKYAQTLEAMKKKFGSAGNTTGMNAAQKEIDSIINTEKLDTTDVGLPNKNEEKSIVGTWNVIQDGKIKLVFIVLDDYSYKYGNDIGCL